MKHSRIALSLAAVASTALEKPAAVRAPGVLRLVRRKVARRSVFQNAPYYGAVEATVLIGIAAYFTVGVVAILFGRTT
jgi:hypothetical protein